MWERSPIILSMAYPTHTAVPLPVLDASSSAQPAFASRAAPSESGRTIRLGGLFA